ncbi:methylmalonyl-CoA mutase [Oikeobacillus pervagus]|uniref:Methylmalonyl-CoA mutase n=1 Tax=Oikeobacillus pervagus TaxID=1325931 RepID=A0AAJ1SVV7_9BACI|nr:methylmalonyl-CoA mutase family protein [Oikeobacillus pervagus]MDQ0213803.1 methylmalonyl-CoA mutase [Oikeobacillus pervagus]
MKIEEMKEQSFPKISVQEWQEKAEASLKGKPLAKLKTETYEKITLKPLYIPSDLEKEEIDQFPGEQSFTRGFSKGGYIEKPFKIAQPLKGKDQQTLTGKLENALQSGQDTISFSVNDVSGWTYDEVKQFFQQFSQKGFPFYLLTEGYSVPFATFLTKWSNEEPSVQLEGVIGEDLLSQGVAKGVIPSEEEMSKFAEMTSALKERFASLKTIVINTAPYHNAGATVVQELAIALSEAVYYIELLQANGWSVAEITEKMVFHFPIGSQFFIELAKLRAFRKIWTTICRGYGLDGDSIKVTIGAETSKFTLSKLDRHVNILRTGSEAFAAVVGGIEYLQVAPFDEPFGQNSQLAERVAKNIPLLLKSESHLDKVIDPAGGSYFVESLTAELGRESWKLFLQLDEQGGIIASLKTGWIQEQITEVMEKRVADLAVRKQSMIGTNIYSDLQEEIPSVVSETAPEIKQQESIKEMAGFTSTETIQPLNGKRLAEPFEQLRERAKKLLDHGEKVQAGLICLGKLKEFKPRADFVTGVLASGGILAVKSDECMTIEDAVQFMKETKLPYYCICGTDQAYEEFVSDILCEVKTKDIPLQIDIAGLMEDEMMQEWKNRGLNGAIYLRQNLLEKLSSLLTIWEGGQSK